MRKEINYLLLMYAILLLAVGCTMPQLSESSITETNDSVVRDELVPYDVLSDGSAIFLKGELFDYSYCFYEPDGSFIFELPSENKGDYPAVSEITDGAVVVRYVLDSDSGHDVGSRYGLIDLCGVELTGPKYNSLYVEPSGLYILGLFLTSENYIQLDLFDTKGVLLDSYLSSNMVQSANLIPQDINPYNYSAVITGETGASATDYCEIIYYKDGKLTGGQVFPKGVLFFPQGRGFGKVVSDSTSVAYQKYDGTPLNSLIGICSSPTFHGDSTSVITIFQEGSDCLLVSQDGQIIGKIDDTADASEIIHTGDYIFAMYVNQEDAWIKAYSQDGLFVKELPLNIKVDVAGGAYVAYENGLYSIANGDGRIYYDKKLNRVTDEPAKGFECGKLLDGRYLIMSQKKSDSIRYAPSGEVVDSLGNPVIINNYSISAQSKLFDWSMQGSVQRLNDDVFCAVDKKGNYGAINTLGDIVIPFDFNDIHVGGKGSNCLVMKDSEWYVYDIKHGLIHNEPIDIYSVD